MALYVPAGRRRRNVILGLVGALVVGLLIGVFVGRITARTLSDQVATVQDSAREITARLRATPNEYAQQLSGSTEFRSGGTVLDSLADAKRSLRSALDDAVWLGPTQRQDLEEALETIVVTARAKVPAQEYETIVGVGAFRIEVGFGIDASASG